MSFTHTGIPSVENVGKNSADLTWTKPKRDGGSGIKGYMVEKRKRGGDWVKALDSPCVGEGCTIPDLIEGEEYEFRVAAVTEAGLGDASLASVPATIKAKMSKLQCRVQEHQRCVIQ